MADISHHLLLWDYPEYSASMWGPILGERIEAERERQRQKKERAKVEGQAKLPKTSQLQTWVGEPKTVKNEVVDLTFQQQLLAAGGQSGGWKDELFSDDLFCLDRRCRDVGYMNDVEWREAREEFARDEPRTQLAPPYAVPVLLPRPKAGLDQPYRNLITFADKFAHICRELPGKGKPRLNWVLQQDYIPKDLVPRKNLDGGYARQPDWSKKAIWWAANTDRIALPHKSSMKTFGPKHHESSSVKVTVLDEVRDVTSEDNLSLQDQTFVSSTPVEVNKPTLVIGRKRRTGTEETNPSTKPMFKKRRLRSALGEVNS